MVNIFQIAIRVNGHWSLSKSISALASFLFRLADQSPLGVAMPKDKPEKKEKKEKKAKDIPEADDVEMADADEPKVFIQGLC